MPSKNQPTSPAHVQRRSRAMGRMPVMQDEDMMMDDGEEDDNEDETGTTAIRHPMAGCKSGASVSDLRKAMSATKRVTTNK